LNKEKVSREISETKIAACEKTQGLRIVKKSKATNCKPNFCPEMGINIESQYLPVCTS
jgi:hypothetical protein